MATWSGWQVDFLSAASLPRTSDNEGFLTDWADHANSSCGNNPNDLHRKEGPSTNCAPSIITGQHYQRYTNHTWARTAWDAQLTGGNFPHLLDALRSGHPYSVNNPQAVGGDLASWGSGNFAHFYFGQTSAGGGPGGSSAQALHGWSDLRRSINRRWPAAMHDSERRTRQALRALSRARKVKL